MQPKESRQSFGDSGTSAEAFACVTHIQHPVGDLERPADAAKFVHMCCGNHLLARHNDLLKAEPGAGAEKTLLESDQCCKSVN